jgi:thioester reductase-like protein
MSVLITGATGYLGSYVTNLLLTEHDERLVVMIRGEDAETKLWRALQLHMSSETFYELLPRIEVVSGDLTAPGLGLDDAAWRRIARSVDSVIHIAASLNRKSARACFNANLRGTLSVIKLARAIAEGGGLRRFSHVSTTGVAGRRDRELVAEDEAIDWTLSDYDPYGRTKKFCEHMLWELLGGQTQILVLRPSIVMGDSCFPMTTQFDMVRAFCTLAELPAVPIRRDARFDIVNADFVGRALVELHVKERTLHDTYHLSAGAGSKTAAEIVKALVSRTRRRPPRFVPGLEGAFTRAVDLLALGRRRNVVTRTASLLKVFMPYITYDTVFDNSRVTAELGLGPVPFTEYCADLYLYAKEAGFSYPYDPLPPRPTRPS